MSVRLSVRPTPVFSDRGLAAAFVAPLCAHKTVNCRSELVGSGAFLYLVMRYRHDPAVRFADGTSVRARILAHFRTLIRPGNEPRMGAGPYWAYPLTAAALTLMKETPDLWSALSSEEIGRADEIMRCFALECAWATNDCNDFWTGMDMFGNFRKGWNPNHRSPAVLPIMLATVYFGSAAVVDDFLVHFDFDAYAARLEALGFTGALANLRRAGKTLLEEGGECFLDPENHSTAGYAEDGDHLPAGRGAGIRHPYVYRGIPLADARGLLCEILLQNTTGGKVTNEVFDHNGNRVAYLMEGSSPVLGMDGMMTELVSHDAKGMRSDISYCNANFCILIPTLATAVELGLWQEDDPANAEASEKTVVSTVDFLYKLTHGYFSFSHGKGRPTNEQNGPHEVYPMAKDMWEAYFLPRGL